MYVLLYIILYILRQLVELFYFWRKIKKGKTSDMLNLEEN